MVGRAFGVENHDVGEGRFASRFSISRTSRYGGILSAQPRNLAVFESRDTRDRCAHIRAYFLRGLGAALNRKVLISL